MDAIQIHSVDGDGDANMDSSSDFSFKKPMDRLVTEPEPVHIKLVPKVVNENAVLAKPEIH